MLLRIEMADLYFVVLFPKLVPLAMKLGLEGMPTESVDFFVKSTDEIVKMRNSSKQVTFL